MLIEPPFWPSSHPRSSHRHLEIEPSTHHDRAIHGGVTTLHGQATGRQRAATGGNVQQLADNSGWQTTGRQLARKI